MILACPSAKHASYLYTANLKYMIFFVLMLGTSLFRITGSGSLLSPLLQKLSERLTTAIEGRDGLDNPGIWTSVGNVYGIDHIQKVMTQELKCN
jgi:hypothetical protein